MTSNANIRLPAFLRRARERHGLTQAELAQRCGVTRTYVCAVEHGRVLGPSVELLEKVLNAMALSRREGEALMRLAAQDRVLRAAAAELPARAQRLISVCLEADRLLPDADVETWISRLEKTVQDRTDFVVHIQRDEETAMT